MANWFVLNFIVILLIQRSLSLLNSPQASAQVNNVKPVTVSRGGHIEIRPTFSINPVVRNRTGCKIRFVHKSSLSCGQVFPSAFSCSYKGVVYYQHFGCFGDKALVTFQLSVVSDALSQVEESTIQVFSTEFHIQDTGIYSDIQLIQISSSFTENNLPPSNTSAYKLIFPNWLVGKCHYELVSEFEHLNLPSYGKISFLPNTLMPCGYTPATFQYKRTNHDTDAKDFVLFRIYSYEPANTLPFYTVIPLEGPADNEQVRNKLVLPQSSLLIRQAVNTPVSQHKFITDTMEIFGLHPIKYRVEVHPGIGSFHTALSTDVNVSFTEFTRDDLIDGCVSFYPHYNALGHSPVSFQYSAILDTSESLSLVGVVVVAFHAIVWEWPAQRTNNPLQVVKGQMAKVDSKTIDFYLLDECETQATMQLLIPPQHGHFLNRNESLASHDSIFSVEAVIEGGVLAYEHSGDEAMYDQMVWQVQCLDGPTMTVSMTVLIAQTDSSLPDCVNSSKAFVYQGWSQPLSLSHISCSPIEEAIIEVLHLEGTLLRAEHILAFNNSSWFFPFVKPTSQSLIVRQFTLIELQQQLIWYVPPMGSNHDAIKFKLINSKEQQTSGIVLTNIKISSQSFNETFLISTTEDYPSIQTASPVLTLPTIETVYITYHYLYTTLPPLSDSQIVYLLSNQLVSGKLCILSNVTCDSSVTQFTQRDINQQLLYFLPSSNFIEEVISVEVTINGIRSSTPNLSKLRIELKKKSNLNGKEDLFVVQAGKEKRIRAKHFPIYPKSTKFRVSQGTVYGSLSYRNYGKGSDLFEFTRQDLSMRRVWYKHDSTATFACSDSFKFDVIFENETKSSSFLIVIRRGRDNLNVNITSKPISLFNTSRFLISKQYFQVTTTFCPELVVFNVVLPPHLGVLSRTDVENSLVVQLKANSTFTLKDIHSGLLHYTLFDPNAIFKNVSDSFFLSASDPISKWPPEYRRLAETGHFPVHITTVDEVHRLDLKITSPRPIAWLSEHNQYGAILGQTDIDITNSTVSPEEVNIQVQLNLDFFYQIQLDSSSVSVFTLTEVYSGRITFAKIIFQERAFEDTVNFDVLVEIKDQYGIKTVQSGSYSLSFVWAFADIDTQTLTVSEESGMVTFFVRRRGPALWFESRLLFETYSGSAVGTNCSESDTSGFDFCHVTELIVFKPNMTEYMVTVKLLDDMVAELDKRFTVMLSQPENVVLNRGSTGSISKTIVINDQSDYAIVRFEGTVSEGFRCQLQLRNVDEGIGVLAINITRRNNLHDQVGILCRTESEIAVEGLDFVGRNSVVWFEVNQTTTTCNITIINDTKYESSEPLRVILEGFENGKALPDQDYSEMCVFIAADINDEPEVSFNATEIAVQESEIHDVLGFFTILRKGPDLSSRTVLQYTYDPHPSATATYGHDFMIYAGDSDMTYCSHLAPGVGCVVFGGNGPPIQMVNFKIFRDSIFEGNETFYLRIIGPVHMAHPGYPNRLKVTIMDASKPTTIGFESSFKVVNESRGWYGVDVVRTGNLQDNVNVTCVFKAIKTTTFTAEFNGPGDVVISLTVPEVINFKPGQNRSSCPFGVIDDDIYEREERFVVYLEANNLQVVIPDNFSSAVVSITDPEDIPTIQFTERNFSAVEPLSNYDVDSRSVAVTLLRTGDIGLIVAIQYSLIDGTAIEGKDYANHTVYGIITFHTGETMKNLSIPLKANHQSNESTTLIVLLSEIDNASSVVIGENSSIAIHVENTALYGPLLPGIPVVTSNGQEHLVYHDMLLHCLMPCMPGYEMGNEKQGQYYADCLNVDTSRTIFTWEYSLDGEHFSLFNTSTVITPINSEILDPIYFQSGMLVRCSCVPVNEDGLNGYPRTSDVVRLGNESRCAEDVLQENRVEMKLSSYDTFGAKNEDLVEISVSLPRIPNTLPVVLAHNIPEELGALLQETVDLDENNRHVCTSINSFDLLKVLSHSHGEQTWYSNLSYTSCTWTFSVWASLSYLKHECRMNITATDSMIALGLHVFYFNVSDQRIQVITEQRLETQLPYTPSSLYLPPPLYYYSEVNNENSYIYLIAVEEFSNSMHIYLYSSSSIELTVFNPLIPSATFSNLTLLHKDKTQGKLAWRLSASNLESVLDTVMSLFYNNQGCEMLNCTPSASQTFKLKFGYSLDKALVPLLEIVSSTKLEGNTTLSYVFKIGDVPTISLKLADYQKIQPGFSLIPKKISILNLTSNLKVEIWNTDDYGSLNSGSLADIQFLKHTEADEISFELNTKFEGPMEFTLVIYWALINANGTRIIEQSTDIFLAFLSIPTPRDLSTTLGLNRTSELHGSLKAAIAIFVLTLIVAMVTLTIIGVFVWMWRVRRGLKNKVQQAHICVAQKKQQIQAVRRISGAASGRTKVSKGTDQDNGLRRTHSTTGFPATVEKYKRQKPKKQHSISIRYSDVITSAGQSLLSRSRSLPDLSKSQLAALPIEIFVERRRNLNKVHTRVKVLNSQQTEAQKSSSEARQRLLKAYRVDNLKTIQDITPKRNNYGVNEGKLNTEKEKGYRKEFASFAVRSIAASAKTPEPGSSPRTVL